MNPNSKARAAAQVEAGPHGAEREVRLAGAGGTGL